MIPLKTVASGINNAPVARDTIQLTLRDVQRMAEERNRSFLALRLDTAIARGALRDARRFPANPTVGIKVPGRRPDGDGSPSEYTLTQEVEWGGQRGLRIAAASRERDEATHRVRNSRRTIVAEVSDVFHQAFSEQQKVFVAEHMLELTEQLLDATRIQLREGEISVLEANLAEVDFGRTRSRVLAARRSLSSALLQLKHLIDLDASATLQLVDDSVVRASVPDDTAMLSNKALRQRPDLAAARAAVQEANILLSLARRERLPNIEIGTIAERDRLLQQTRIGMTFGLSVPLLNRNQGVTMQRKAEFNRALFEAQALESRVLTEVADALQAYNSTLEEVTLYESTVLEPTRRNIDLLDAAYKAGKVALPTVLLLRNQLLDAELEYWDVWLQHRIAAIRLQAVVDA